MKIVLSPSKTKTLSGTASKGFFQQKISDALVAHMAALPIPVLMKALKLDETKAQTLHEFYVAYPTVEQGCAVESYDGIAFKYLNWSMLSDEAKQFGNDHLAIMSGLYGVVEPTSPMTNYRLDVADKTFKDIPLDSDMVQALEAFSDASAVNASEATSNTSATKTKSTTGKIKSTSALYELWQTSMDNYFNGEDWILNLASKEYAKMISHPIMVTVEFWENKSGTWKQLSTSSKIMRGTMARYCLEHQVQTVEALPDQLGDFHRVTEVVGITVPMESMTIRYEL